MGSKGSNTTTTNQQSTYQPNPQAAGYINAAMGRATSAANNPFAIPQAPVAGFSQDQQGAFQQFRDAQGAAQPYYDQAQKYFSPQGTQDFYNPYAANVMANMQDVFGAQRTQQQGNLTQAAGGVGADRIAVGQGELDKQQGLAAGQTMADLWARAGAQAQQAGQGQMNLGNAVQNSKFTGANAMLGVGGLQQQLSQAQMNSPYQQQLAMAAFPYQQAQFLAGITGSLAPGLGGTNTGNSTTTGPAPSIWSQLLGAGTAAVGAYGGAGGFNGSGGFNPFGSYDAYGGGNAWNSAYGGSASSPLPGLSASDYGNADGGRIINPYADGGSIPNSDPIDISHASIIPQVQMQPIQPHIPQINLNPPQQQQSGSGGPSLGDIAKVAMMFAADGGRVDPFFASGGDSDVLNPDEPYRLAGPDAMQTWREDSPDVSPTGAIALSGPGTPTPAVAAINRAARPAPVPPTDRATVADATGEGAGALGAQGVSPYSQPSAAPPRRDPGFAGSPWAALMQAGLGMMSGTSPYAGVNIGQGAMQGMRTLQQQRENEQKDETIDQAARRLQQEAEHHRDSYGIQKQQLEISRKNADKESWSSAGSVMTKDGLHPLKMESSTGQMIDGITGKPPTETDTVIPKGGSRNSPEEIASVVDAIADGSQPPVLTGLYGDSVHVRAGLKAKGFNLAKAQQEWDGAKKLTASVNAPRMVAYVGLNKSVDRTIDEVKALADELKQGGVPLLNKLQLTAYIKAQGNSEKGQLATRYMTAVNTLREEFANLANGGYAPTEAAWKLANEQVNGDFGVKQMHASLDEIQRLIRYRIQAIPGLATQGPDAPNRYTRPGATPPASTPPNTGGGSGKPDMLKRFEQLTTGAGAKTEEEAYAILHDEGYQ